MSQHAVKQTRTDKLCCANCHAFSGVSEGEKRAWLSTSCPSVFARPHPSHSTRWVTAQLDLLCVKCGVGLRGYGLKGVCRRNAKEHPLRRPGVTMPTAQLVEDDAIGVDLRAPTRARNEAGPSGSTAGVGNSTGGSPAVAAVGDVPSVEDWDLGPAENGRAQAQPADTDPTLGQLLGNRVAQEFDDPEGDPFAFLGEEEDGAAGW